MMDTQPVEASLSLREAAPEDYPEMLSIYNDALLSSTAIYSDELGDIAFMADYVEGRQKAGYPFIVALDGKGKLVAYGSYGQFRARTGYRFTVEHSVYTQKALRGQGAGSAVLKSLIEKARAQDYHLMIGAVDASNEGSLRFHDRLGFTRSSPIREVGRKFDRWLDLVFVQLILK